MVEVYYAMIELLDHVIGGVLGTLDRCGQRDNTLVLFMSDHGEMLGDHGLLLKGCRFYEGLVRVPLLFSWPRGLARGVVSDALVEAGGRCTHPGSISPGWSRWRRCTAARCCRCYVVTRRAPSTDPWCAANTTARSTPAQGQRPRRAGRSHADGDWKCWRQSPSRAR